MAPSEEDGVLCPAGTRKSRKLGLIELDLRQLGQPGRLNPIPSPIFIRHLGVLSTPHFLFCYTGNFNTSY